MHRHSFLRAVLRPVLVAVVVAAALVPTLVAAPAAVAATVPPGPTNTGPNGQPLQVINGFYILNQAGKTYSNLDIHGRVRVLAPNITLANSIVRGDNSQTLGSLIDANYPNYNHTNFTVRDSILYAQYPSVYQDGILGHDYTVTRTEIRGTVDAVKVVGNNVRVQQSWLHDTTFIPASRSPYHSDTHNDGVQIVTGSNIVITQNTIAGNSNTALMVTQDAGPSGNVTFTQNWSRGGQCTVNLAPKPRPAMAGPITVTSNLFRHDTGVPNCAIIANTGANLVQSGNMWSDTNTPVTVSRGM